MYIYEFVTENATVAIYNGNKVYMYAVNGYFSDPLLV